MFLVRRSILSVSCVCRGGDQSLRHSLDLQLLFLPDSYSSGCLLYLVPQLVFTRFFLRAYSSLSSSVSISSTCAHCLMRSFSISTRESLPNSYSAHSRLGTLLCDFSAPRHVQLGQQYAHACRQAATSYYHKLMPRIGIVDE